MIELPFSGRPGEGDRLRFYLTRPVDGPSRPPVAMVWAGIDTWKEEMHGRLGALLRSRGFAVLLVDMPGVGQSPVLAGPDAERQWTPIFDWLAGRNDLDGARCAAIGGSFGGYWAMKLAYTHRERLSCSVNWGGGVHITFTPKWQQKSRNASSYLMDLIAARAAIFGGETFEDYVARCPELSLLSQGLLDQPCAPLLLVNGRDDVQNWIDDIYLSLDAWRPQGGSRVRRRPHGRGPDRAHDRQLGARPDRVAGSMSVRRIVTGHDQAGRSVIAEDAPVAATGIAEDDDRSDTRFFSVWATHEMPVDLSNDGMTRQRLGSATTSLGSGQGSVIRIGELAPGTRSPMQVWHNTSEQPCRLAWILLDAGPSVLG